MFGNEPWHGLEPFVDDSEPEGEEPKWDPIKPTIPNPDPVAVYLYWRAYKNQPVPSFDPGWSPQYSALYSDAVGLAEIGVVKQVEKVADMQKGISPRTVGKSPQDYEKVPAWLYAGIIGAAGAAFSIVIRGAKGGAFQTSKKYGWATRGRGPLWKVSVDTAGQLALGYSAKGMEIVKENVGMGPTGYPLAPYGSGGK